MRDQFDELRERLLAAGVAAWHVRRYLRELREHLADLTTEGERAGQSRDAAHVAALARLGSVDELARALIAKRQLQAWSARAPWAVFSLIPLGCLVAAYLASCLVLWSGWRIFLPNAETPFVPVDGAAMIYFSVGRMLYWFAPLLVGWGIAFSAARQRMKLLWPVIGLAVVALLGCMTQVHAAGSAFDVSMRLTMGASSGETTERLTRAVAIFTFSAFPYAVWRLRRPEKLENE